MDYIEHLRIPCPGDRNRTRPDTGADLPSKRWVITVEDPEDTPENDAEDRRTPASRDEKEVM